MRDSHSHIDLEKFHQASAWNLGSVDGGSQHPLKTVLSLNFPSLLPLFSRFWEKLLNSPLPPFSSHPVKSSSLSLSLLALARFGLSWFARQDERERERDKDKKAIKLLKWSPTSPLQSSFSSSLNTGRKIWNPHERFQWPFTPLNEKGPYCVCLSVLSSSKSSPF